MLLRTTLFVTGAVVMSLEFLASRTLATEFGDNLPVWGALIGTFIGALSLGYWLGGVLADRYPSRVSLAAVIAVSGLFTSAMVWPTRAITGAIYEMQIAGASSAWAKPLLACSVIYLVPVALLGAVSPYCVKLAAHDLSKIGKKVGGLYAVSSLGSIFGTFFTAFYLIEVRWGVRATIRYEGILLIVLAALLLAIQLLPRRAAA